MLKCLVLLCNKIENILHLLIIFLCCLNLTICQSIQKKEEKCLKAKNIFLVKIRDRRIHLPATTT